MGVPQRVLRSNGVAGGDCDRDIGGAAVSDLIITVLLAARLITLPMALEEMAVREGVDPELAACIVSYETGHTWDVLRRGDLDERGLFQVLPSTAYWAASKMGWDGFTLAWLDDPVKNMQMGLWILARWPEWFSTLYLCK